MGSTPRKCQIYGCINIRGDKTWNDDDYDEESYPFRCDYHDEQGTINHERDPRCLKDNSNIAKKDRLIPILITKGYGFCRVCGQEDNENYIFFDTECWEICNKCVPKLQKSLNSFLRSFLKIES